MRFRTTAVAAAVVVSLCAVVAWGVRPALWVQTTEAHFASGKFESTVSTSLGRVGLARRIKVLASSESAPPVVSAVVVAGNTLYAGSGTEAVIYKVQGGKAVKFAELPSTMICCLEWTGRELLAGTGGDKAGIYRIDGRGKAQSVWADEKVKYVWALVRNDDGSFFAATGPEGKVFAVDKAGKGQVIYHADKLAKNVLCLIAGEDGKLCAGTDEKGLVIEIDPKAKTGRVLMDAQEKEIAALALAEDGTLLAATSDASKASADGAKQPSTTKAGKADNGKKPPQTKPAPKAEPDKKPPATNKPAKPEDKPKPKPKPEAPDKKKPTPGEKPKEPETPKKDDKPKDGAKPDGGDEAKIGVEPKPDKKETIIIEKGPAGKPSSPSAAAPKPSTRQPSPSPRSPLPPGVRIIRTSRPTSRPPTSTSGAAASPTGNAVYLIRPDGLVDTVFRKPVTILAMALMDDKLVLGTGNGGGIYCATLDGDEVSLLADTDAKQITSLAVGRGGEITFGTANKGSVGRLEAGLARKGTFTAKAMDAKQIARWGTIQVDGEAPAGAKVTIATRSGNVEEPDEKTWSSWSAETPLQGGFLPIGSPAGRFLQYRLTFTSNGKAAPSVGGVKIVFQVGNLAPNVAGIMLQASPKGRSSNETAGGAMAWRHVAVQAADRNGDKLRLKLEFREVGTESWVSVIDNLFEPKYVWDTRSVADGTYELRVTASDDPVNPRSVALSGARISDPFVIDNTAPAVKDLAVKVAGGKVAVTGQAVDGISRIASIYYSVDSQTKWVALLPTDGICDSPSEKFAFDIEDLKPGAHRIAIRVADVLVNVGYASIIVNLAK